MSIFLATASLSKPVPPRQEAGRVSAFYGRLLAGWLLLWLGAGPGAAQRSYGAVQPPTPAATGAPRLTAVALPFFDDFSTSAGQPDPALWAAGGGVFVNNTLGLNPPSRNVATFDGLDRAGRPYGLGQPMGVQPTDTLTARPIDLSGLSPRDSVYLSFYWQRQGLGELPDDEDSLRLQFLTSQNRWVTVWKAPLATTVTTFSQTLVPVRAAAYFHAGFQFRFQSFGRASGAFDTWHLDYVYLNKGRNAADRFIRDIAVRGPLTPFLRRYTAMPLAQYRAAPARETADTIRTDIVNLFNNFNVTTLRFTVRELTTGQTLQAFTDPSPQPIAALATQRKAVRPLPLPASFAGQRALLRSTIDVLTTDNQNPSIPTVNLRRNDTLSGLTVLDDYYAYDDGSAELAINSGRAFTRFMVRFVVNRPDAVTSIRLHFVPYLQDATNQPFTLAVLASQQGRPGPVLHQQAAQLRYGSGRNGFVDYPLTREGGVAVTDTFYVGWTQISEGSQGFAVGFDKNGGAFSSGFFVNIGAGWNLGSDLSPDVRGVPMIRPVMGGRAANVVTGPTAEPTAPLRVFPNPTHGPIGWDDPALRHLDVFDATGRLLRSLSPPAGQQQADLSELPPGLYYLRLRSDRRSVTQKLLRLP